VPLTSSHCSEWQVFDFEVVKGHTRPHVVQERVFCHAISHWSSHAGKWRHFGVERLPSVAEGGEFNRSCYDYAAGEPPIHFKSLLKAGRAVLPIPQHRVEPPNCRVAEKSSTSPAAASPLEGCGGVHQRHGHGTSQA